MISTYKCQHWLLCWLERDKDQDGRTVARVTVDRKDVPVELVKAGLAWFYKKYSAVPCWLQLRWRRGDSRRAMVDAKAGAFVGAAGRGTKVDWIF